MLAPSFFKRIGISPAVASSPFVQTANDITGILIRHTPRWHCSGCCGEMLQI
ncbi:MAG: hypothetical protein MZV49_14725 [Rhodopseudomonas palustris]|nr:hypothetical protein [Rhodopseudomonas palustris]